MASKKNKKPELLQRFAKSVKAFYPALDRHFMCPTCLAAIPVGELSRISEAHIVPRAAGGSLKTYVCKPCNDKFGANQDRWFGEFLQLRRRIHAKEDVSILDAPTRPGYFTIDDERVQGSYRTEANGALGFYIDPDRNSPDLLRRIANSRPTKIGVPVPLLRHQGLVDVGFLTAAYLLWFKELGYSWPLQAHLDQVRQQIQAPNSRIIEARYWVACRDTFAEQPWVGVTFIRNDTVLVAALGDRLVVLPPADGQNVYSLLETQIDALTTQFHPLRFREGRGFSSPMGLVYRDRALVSPDVILKEGRGAYLLYPPGGEGRPRILHPTNLQEVQAMRAQQQTTHINVGGRIEIPLNATGSPPKAG